MNQKLTTTLLLFFALSAAYGQEGAATPGAEIKTLSTVNDITELIDQIKFQVLPNVEMNKIDKALIDGSYLTNFESYLKYHLASPGKSIVIFPDKIVDFISLKVQQGIRSADLDHLIIKALNTGAFVRLPQSASLTP